MTDEEVLRKLLKAESDLLGRLALIKTAIKVVGMRYSKGRGYLVPLTRATLEQELNQG